MSKLSKKAVKFIMKYQPKAKTIKFTDTDGTVRRGWYLETMIPPTVLAKLFDVTAPCISQIWNGQLHRKTTGMKNTRSKNV